MVPNQAATAVAARLPSSLSSTGSPRLSPTKSLRDNACSTGSPAAASRRPLRSWVPTRVVRRADMTDLLNSEKAASKARDLLASRVTVIEKLADAAQANDAAQVAAHEAEKTLAAAYADAERAGWSGAELAQFGVRKPERRAPGRPRTARKPAATAAPTPSSSGNLQAD